MGSVNLLTDDDDDDDLTAAGFKSLQFELHIVLKEGNLHAVVCFVGVSDRSV